MELYYTGVIIAISTFLIIGIFHPIVSRQNIIPAPDSGGCFS